MNYPLISEYENEIFQILMSLYQVKLLRLRSLVLGQEHLQVFLKLEI